MYISGRKRAKGEMNGKSGNVNNICNQLYPDRLNIPGNEILCIFDADQVFPRDESRRDFAFQKTKGVSGEKLVVKVSKTS